MIGENLQILRKRKNLTQETLAEKVGVARQTIVKWEAGESSPDLAAAEKLADGLEVSLDDLVNAPPEEFMANGPNSGRYIFGLVTVGEKGQIVIPIRARKLFHIAPGDQLMVLGDEDRGIALMDARFFMEIAGGMKHGF